MQIFFSYQKKLVIQALRFHFLTRPEIKLLMIVVNVFAILAAGLFFFEKVSPVAFLISSLLWMVLMICFWFILPNTVYKKASTFRDEFRMSFNQHHVMLENERGHTDWQWHKFSTYIESAHFIHLYFDTRSFFLVPKAAMDQEQLDELRQLLRENLKRN